MIKENNMPVYYYIRSTTEKDDKTGESLYWNNELGWVGFQKATHFEYDEKLDFDLPANSYWF